MFLLYHTLYRSFVRTFVRTTPFIPVPNTKKNTTKCQNAQYKVGSCSMQGWRLSMEDAHVHFLNTPKDKSAAFFAVYDGHGGAGISEYLGLNLHNAIIGNSEYMKGNYHAAIQKGFLDMDQELKKVKGEEVMRVGSTAVTVLIKNNTIFCGNAGDSRAVLSQNGEAIALSFDHKPENMDEKKRIEAAKGWVSSRRAGGVPRVNGSLSLSRAFGDFIFKLNPNLHAKDQIITVFPDVIEVPISNSHEFIVIACDGIWDVISNKEAVEFCRKGLSQGKPPEQISSELVDHCLATEYNLLAIGCDNLTLIIVCLMQGRSDEEFIECLKRKHIHSGDSIMN